MRTQRTTTSATLVDIPGVSTTITLDTTSHIRVELNVECSLYSNPASTLGLAISINGVDHDETGIHLSGAGDAGVATVGHRTETPLAAGTYTVKGRMRRQSGSGTVAVDTADLFVFALQGAKGDAGPAGPEGLPNISAQAQHTGTVPLLLLSALLPAGDYAPPAAMLGCVDPAQAATLEIVKESDGTTLATIGGTAGGLAWREAAAGFSLAAETLISIGLAASTAGAVAVVRGLDVRRTE
jgi:hypothetical protein